VALDSRMALTAESVPSFVVGLDSSPEIKFRLIGPAEGRFDHYELMRREDGTFAELGRVLWESPTAPWTLSLDTKWP
jgi:hypothetical protein